ncbi:MAG TPA: SOS response-associated peptidase [Blastocatellia bacterium]|nr:SOS response-associated peptidase [Blastocatellia bacterium]
MCGRFVRKRSSSAMARDFGVQEITDDLQPSFNVAPTDKVAVVLNNGVKQLVAMRWGLVPFWATDPKIASKHINARAETLTVKPAFKDAFKRRRCLVVADGFFEWQKQGATKIPMFIHLEPERPFGFAGLYEIWTPPLGEKLVTCTIITTEANELVRPIHDRMPVILPKDAEDFWLDSAVEDHTRLLDLLQPYQASDMSAFTVSKLVNSVKNNSPECIEPVSAMGQPPLF